MLAKAPTLEADEFVVDLEDSVAATAKNTARTQVVEALASESWAQKQVSVRVNAVETEWCEPDLVYLAAAPGSHGSIVLPKTESAADIAYVERVLGDGEREAGRKSPIRVQALIETATGMSRLAEIASASDRLEALILGYADLAASLGRTVAGAADLDAWRPAQEALLVAARANGLQAIDGPYLRITADKEFAAAATRVRDAGFDGKWAIHPSQIDVLNELFTPGEAEIDHAREVIAALERAEREDRDGAVELDGQMIDEAIRAAALRTLARASQA